MKIIRTRAILPVVWWDENVEFSRQYGEEIPIKKMLETNDEWAVTRRYMSLETLAYVTETPNVMLPAVAS